MFNIQKLIGVFVLALFFSPKNIYAQDKNWTNKDSCYSCLEIYSKYWKKDNLGKNGFRELMANTVLSKCQFKGHNWNDLSKFLGAPNFKFNNSNTLTYRYRLNYPSSDVKAIGTMLLDIQISKTGQILKFSIFSVDG